MWLFKSIALLEETLIEMTTENQQHVIIIVGEKDTLKIDQHQVWPQEVVFADEGYRFMSRLFFKMFWVFNISLSPQLTTFIEILIKIKIISKSISAFSLFSRLFRFVNKYKTGGKTR